MLLNQSLMQPSMTCLSCQLGAGGLIPTQNSIDLSMQIRLYISTQNFIVTKHFEENGKEMLGNMSS
jgi:hypothetical protein